MTKRKDIHIELDTIGIGKVMIGGQDISSSVRGVEVRANAHDLTEVILEVLPESVTILLEEADVTINEMPSR